MKKDKSLEKWINELQQSGRYWFTQDQALSVLQYSKKTISMSIYRLVQKNRVMNIKSGFYVIVPIEYSYQGTLPPTWFMHDLMKYLNYDYYVGLLSAASFHGAAHQAPQIFQIITERTLKRIEIKNMSIHFYRNKWVTQVPTLMKRTPTGDIKVSTPAATAFDLIKYMSSSGGLSNVPTVLSELIESIKPKELTNIINSFLYDRADVQRLGFLFDQKEIGGQKLAKEIYEVSKKIYSFRNTLLNSHSIQKTGNIDQKWCIVINDVVEVEV